MLMLKAFQFGMPFLCYLPKRSLVDMFVLFLNKMEQTKVFCKIVF